MKRSVKITLLGQELAVRTEADERYLQRVLELLNGKLEEVQESGQAVSTVRVALMAALNLADTCVRLEEERTRLHDRARGLVEVIEAQIP